MKYDESVTAETVSVEYCEELFETIRSGLISIEKAIKEFIRVRGWVKLGYASFAEAWNERLDGINLAQGALKAHVVYALLDTETPETIGATVTGISTTAAKRLKEQKDLGKPADLATVRVNTFLRRPPSEPSTIRVPVTPEEYAVWSGLVAVERGDMGEYSANVLRKHFSKRVAEALGAAA